MSLNSDPKRKLQNGRPKTLEDIISHSRGSDMNLSENDSAHRGDSMSANNVEDLSRFYKNNPALASFNQYASYKSLMDLGVITPADAKDVAQDEAKHWGATEDDEFVIPWYTHAVRFLLFPAIIIICYYIYWRTSRYESNGTWMYDTCAWLFILSESFCFAFISTQWVWMVNLKFRKKVTQADLNMSDDDLPTFDIMIPCYTEPPEIVQMTLNSCYDLDYPADKITVYVCDDGKSDSMRDMVAAAAARYEGEMKTRYIARTKTPGVPHHAKAGNLNNCILNEGSTGDLILILDCDMLPEPCLTRTVAPFFFKAVKNNTDVEAPSIKAVFDEDMGLLQTPQGFYNLDHNDLLGQSYAYFYQIVISGWDGSGCTPCCGTGVTFGRKALTSIGGFSYGSITEDFKTSMVLCAAGFKCKYFLQFMTRGVSPKELNAFMTQRLRWAVGAIQIFKNQNPLFVKGLTPTSRWLYFFSTIGMIYILPMAFMLVVMYGTILIGFPISFGPSSFYEYIALAGSAMMLMMVIQYLIAWRLSFSHFMRILQDNFTVSFLFVRAMLIGFFGLNLGFACTKKDVSFDLRENLWHAAPHLTIYAITGFAMLKAACEMLDQQGVIDIFWNSDYDPTLLVTPMFWTALLWVLLSGPPRMVWYGYRRSKREAKSKLKNLNQNVPILQELPSTPVNIFPPLSPEIWQKEHQAAQTERAVSNSETSERSNLSDVVNSNNSSMVEVSLSDRRSHTHHSDTPPKRKNFK